MKGRHCLEMILPGCLLGEILELKETADPSLNSISLITGFMTLDKSNCRLSIALLHRMMTARAQKVMRNTGYSVELADNRN